MLFAAARAPFAGLSGMCGSNSPGVPTYSTYAAPMPQEPLAVPFAGATAPSVGLGCRYGSHSPCRSPGVPAYSTYAAPVPIAGACGSFTGLGPGAAAAMALGGPQGGGAPTVQCGTSQNLADPACSTACAPNSMLQMENPFLQIQNMAAPPPLQMSLRAPSAITYQAPPVQSAAAQMVNPAVTMQ